MNTSPVLSLITVSYNVSGLLAQCLESVARETDASYELIVIDNASADDSVARVNHMASSDPRIRVISNRENRGFAAANNQALRIASGEFVVFLNPDTIVLDGALDLLLAFMRQNPRAGAAGPVIVGEDCRTVQYFCGRKTPSVTTELYRLTRLDRIFSSSERFGAYLMSYWDHLSTRRVEVLMGACMIIRKSVIDEIGLMDEDMFMFADDVEYCLRIRRTGAEIWLCADARIVHYMGKSCETNFDRSFMTGIVSMNIFFRKYYGAMHSIMYRILLMCAYVPRIIYNAVRFRIRRVKLYTQIIRWALHG